MNNQIKYFTAIIFLFVSSYAYSQNVTAESFNIPELRILESKGGNNFETSFNSEHNFVLLTDDSLKINPVKEHYSAGLNDISRVTIKSGSSFWNGAFAGSITGFVFGFILGSTGAFFDYKQGNIAGGIAGGLLLSLPFAALTGAIGEFIFKNVDYDVGNYSKEDKKAFLVKLLRDKRIKTND